ncbi:MAG: hypothetical protein IJ637_06020 [Prevotella sp.]|nr:hypothetical protein [Prevotella sp.]
MHANALLSHANALLSHANPPSSVHPESFDAIYEIFWRRKTFLGAKEKFFCAREMNKAGVYQKKRMTECSQGARKNVFNQNFFGN